MPDRSRIVARFRAGRFFQKNPFRGPLGERLYCATRENRRRLCIYHRQQMRTVNHDGQRRNSDDDDGGGGPEMVSGCKTYLGCDTSASFFSSAALDDGPSENNPRNPFFLPPFFLSRTMPRYTQSNEIHWWNEPTLLR